jgi:hypothetical protein
MQMSKVVCATCGKSYPALKGMKKTQQAYRCSATVYGNQITGHYGSTVIDLETWQFPNGRPEHIKEGIICDEDIEKLISEGLIVIQERGVW